MLARCSLYAHLKGLPDAPVYARMKDMLDAAARISMGWSYRTKAMFQAAISPVRPPSGEITWQSMIPLATRNLKRIDDVLKQVAFICSPGLLYYPKHGHSPDHQHTLYKLQLDFNKCKLVGSLRAGAKIFPHPGGGCRACGHIDNSIPHILWSCKSIRYCLNVWLRRVEPSTGPIRMTLSEQAFTQSILDLSSFSTKADRRATVTLVWDSTQAAIRTATRRRDGN